MADEPMIVTIDVSGDDESDSNMPEKKGLLQATGEDDEEATAVTADEAYFDGAELIVESHIDAMVAIERNKHQPPPPPPPPPLQKKTRNDKPNKPKKTSL